MKKAGPVEYINRWHSWSDRQKGVFAAAFAMGLSNPTQWVEAMTSLNINEGIAQEPAHVCLARCSVDLTDQQFLSWWPVANVISLRLRSRPSLAQAQSALREYRSLQKGLSALPVIAWQSLSSPARLAWPVAFLNNATNDSLTGPEEIHNRACLADQRCQALIPDEREVDFTGYSHWARHLFKSQDFRSWLIVERIITADPEPLDEQYIKKAQRSIDMARSDFS